MELENKLHDILDIARFAPSVHNAQPWKVKITGNNSLTIILDATHTPVEGDPTGRQSVISLGIFVESIAVAAGTVGVAIKDIELKDKAVNLRFDSKPIPATPKEQAILLRRRRTDRSIYKPAEITPEIAHELEAVRKSPVTTVNVATDPALIAEIADLTSKGIGVALSSPKFRYELSGYLTLPWSKKRRGIAVRSLYIPFLIEVLEPWLMKLGVGLRAEVTLEKRRWESASGVVIITADGDMPKYWFDVGRTYLQVSLQAEALGLSQATSAAIVEASNYHEDIEERLGTNRRILALIRLGKGSARKHYSPRVSVEELLT